MERNWSPEIVARILKNFWKGLGVCVEVGGGHSESDGNSSGVSSSLALAATSLTHLGYGTKWMRYSCSSP
ncbi:hypothetical protein Y032_0323g2509 [Ancylostoma ceylanicum]|uniref:Uncharacterized protein n=1 Tax=Ancylostoma ceylanicum TaxID=53326 RepID=A0A016S0I6_9BILA|nr:hypothetical protein Y032_0323g2509 [Ancylostoma ceylanicum]